jgi:hypothetical protein
MASLLRRRGLSRAVLLVHGAGAGHRRARLQFIRSGEDRTLFTADDFYEHSLAHITANTNGTVTVNDLTVNATCQ